MARKDKTARWALIRCASMSVLGIGVVMGGFICLDVAGALSPGGLARPENIDSPFLALGTGVVLAGIATITMAVHKFGRGTYLTKRSFSDRQSWFLLHGCLPAALRTVLSACARYMSGVRPGGHDTHERVIVPGLGHRGCQLLPTPSHTQPWLVVPHVVTP